MKKKKVIEKYIVIDECDQAIVEWCDTFAIAKTVAIDYCQIEGADTIILKIDSAFRTFIPEEPEPEIIEFDLDEL